MSGQILVLIISTVYIRTLNYHLGAYISLQQLFTMATKCDQHILVKA